MGPFRLEHVETVATHEACVAAGLHHWPDGTIGILRHAGQALAVGPNGRSLARHDLVDAGGHPVGLLEGLVQPEESLVDAIEPADHLSGGPLWLHPETGTIVLSYHAERFTDDDPTDYWSWLGMAAGGFDGRPFRDLGTVLTSDVPEHAPQRLRPIDLGPGALVERNGYLFVYSFDRNNLRARVHLGVARAPVEEVVAAAAAGRAPRLRKYFAGRFDEPGIGGRATDLLARSAHWIAWLDVADAPRRGCLVLVHSSPLQRKRGQTKWGLVVRTSVDGIAWSDGQVVYEGPYGTELIYVTVDGGGGPRRTIDGDGFDLYVTRSAATFRWDDADLLRLTVSWA